MSTIGPERAANLIAELRSRMLLDQALHYDVVIENDLAGRAVLAVLWTHRSQLTIHIATDEPTASYVLALKAALETVRNAPSVHLIDLPGAHQLAAAAEHLIWAIDLDRTEPPTRATLQERSPGTTSMPLFTGFASLDDTRPDQTDRAHELVLRDAMNQHARFLNFFGDRFDPRDLYERSKYPRWFIPPEDFEGGLPQVWCHEIDPVGTVLHHREFSGTLQFQPEEMQVGARCEVDFTSLGNIFTTVVDLTVTCNTSSCAHGGLQLQVHRNAKLAHSSDLASGQPSLDIPLSRLQPGDSLRVSLVVTEQPSDHPAPCAIPLRLAVHPPGTHAKPNALSRFRTWLSALSFRRRQGFPSHD